MSMMLVMIGNKHHHIVLFSRLEHLRNVILKMFQNLLERLPNTNLVEFLEADDKLSRLRDSRVWEKATTRCSECDLMDLLAAALVQVGDLSHLICLKMVL